MVPPGSLPGMRPCVKCGSTDETTVYTVSAGADTAVIVLCPKDGQPIRELATLGRVKPEPDEDAGPPPSRGLHAVVPID
ncbi:hypothetical protein GCM10029963_28290 [Micromonospora andamanensis]|nr:hypothetical protein Vwe01_18640 [Micromonospora andamanensis]